MAVRRAIRATVRIRTGIKGRTQAVHMNGYEQQATALGSSSRHRPNNNDIDQFDEDDDELESQSIRHTFRRNVQNQSLSESPSLAPIDVASPVKSRTRRPSMTRSPLAALNAGLHSVGHACYELLHYDELPAWAQDNAFIRRGHRLNIGWRNSIRSLWACHSETFNVWSHLLGFIVMLILTIVMLNTMSPFGMDRIDFTKLMESKTLSPFIQSMKSMQFNDSTHANLTIRSIFAPPSVRIHDFMSMSPGTVLNDAINKLNSHLPNMDQIVDSLERRRLELASQLTLSNSSAAAFESHVSSIRQRVADMKQSINTALKPGSELMGSQLDELRTLVADAGDWTHHLLQDREDFDFVGTTRSILQQFAREVSDDDVLGKDMNAVPTPNLTQQQRSAQTHQPDSSLQSGSESDADSLEYVSYHAYLPRWPIAIFMLSAMCCLLFSAIFHLFVAVNFSWAVIFQCLDYAGICLLISGSNVPIIYYGFYCLPFYRHLYLLIISALGVAGFAVSILPRFRSHRYRTFRTLMFVGLGFSGVIPLIHLLIHMNSIHFIFHYMLLMGIIYIAGAGIYVSQIPERFAPGKFDLFGASHNLWHLAVFAAVLVHWAGVMKFYEWRMSRVCTQLR